VRAPRVAIALAPPGHRPDGDRREKLAGAVLKRLVDLGGAILLLIVAMPVMALVACTLALVQGGPVIFWQQRVGLRGHLFWFPKFASMRPDAAALQPALSLCNDHGDSLTFKMRRDPRVTRIGRVIRALSIDELPQLWSVLRGDMSLVGPRPPLPSEVARYTAEQRRRLEVIPGLTCIWQVSGRSEIPFVGQVALDLAYIDTHTLGLDLALLLRTIPAVLSCRGAY